MNAENPKKSFLQNKIFYLLSSLFVLLFAIVLALPSLVSTEWGKKQVTKIMSRSIHQDVSIKKLKLSWFGDQNIEGVVIHTPEGKQIGFLGRLSTDSSLFNLLRYGFKHVKYDFSDLEARITTHSADPIYIKDVKGELTLGQTSLDPSIIKLSGVAAQGQLIGQFMTDILFSGIQSEALLSSKAYQIENLDSKSSIVMKMKAHHLPIDLLEYLVKFVTNIPQGILHDALGDQIDLSLDQTITKSGLVLQLEAHSPTLSANLTGHLQPDQFIVDKAGKIFLKITPELLNQPIIQNIAKIDLGNSSSLDLTIEKLLLDKDQLKIDFIAKAFISSLNEETAFSGNLFIQDWLKESRLNLNDITINSQVEFNKIPVIFLENFSQQKGLIDLLGDSFNLNLHLISTSNPSDSKPGFLEIALQGNHFDANISLQLDSLVHLKDPLNPGTLSFTLTPKSYKFFKSHLDKGDLNFNPLMLSSPSEIHAKISYLSFPWKKDIQNLSTQAGATFEIAIDKLDFIDNRSKQNFLLQNIQANFGSKNFSKQITYDFYAKQKPIGDLILKGAIERLFTPEGEVNTSDLSITMESQLKDFPTRLYQFISLEQLSVDKVEALFGPTINANFSARLNNMNGPIKGHIEGKNGHIVLNANISQGILSLKENFIAEFSLTPELGQYVFSELFPLFSHIISAENPLTFHLNAKGFSLPIKDFSLSKIQIDQASLQMGRVKFANKGQLGQILSILRITDVDQIGIWFTPLYLSMHEGIIKLERLDMQILDRFPIATWGMINLPKDKLNIVIGLTGQAISQAFGIKGIGREMLVQIPLRGPLSNASIDKKAAVAKISGLLAQNQGPHGKILGTVLNIAGGGLSDEKAPAPTTNPLPWETGDEASEKNESDVRDRDNLEKEKIKIKPKKEIEKGAQKLLEKIFH